MSTIYDSILRKLRLREVLQAGATLLSPILFGAKVQNGLDVSGGVTASGGPVFLHFGEDGGSGGYVYLSAGHMEIGWVRGGADTWGARVIASSGTLRLSAWDDTARDGAGESAELLISGGSVYLNGEAQPTSGGVADIASAVVASGGYLKAPTVVTDTTATSAFIPVLSGGTQYRYTQELTTLSVGSVADVPVEDEIIFSAGAVVSPPVSVAISASEWEDVWGRGSGEISKPLLTLTSAAGWVATVSVDSEFWDGEDDESLHCTMSAALVSSGGVYVISCWGENSTYMDAAADSVSSTYSGIFASSPDMVNWTIVSSACMIWGAADVEWDDGYDMRSLRFTSFGIAGDGEVVPCEISLPPTVRFLNSGALMPVSSGGVYVMNFKDNVLAMGEVKEREAAE